MNQNAIDTYKRAQASFIRPLITSDSTKMMQLSVKLRTIVPVVEGLMADVKEISEEMEAIRKRMEYGPDYKESD